MLNSLFLLSSSLSSSCRTTGGHATRVCAFLRAKKSESRKHNSIFSSLSLSLSVSLPAHPSRLSAPPFPHLIPSFAQWPRARFDHGRTHARTTGQWAEWKRGRERERARERESRLNERMNAKRGVLHDSCFLNESPDRILCISEGHTILQETRKPIRVGGNAVVIHS